MRSPAFFHFLTVTATLCSIFSTTAHAFVPVPTTRCSSSTKQQPTTASLFATKTSNSNAMTTARNGLSFEDVEVGTGRRVNKGDAILCYYEGSFVEATNNPLSPTKRTVFDSTEDGEPLEFVVGKGQLIPGMDLGIVGDVSLEIDPMKIGGDRKLKIPAALAYGAQQVGPIPPNTDLEFQIEIVNAQPASGLSGDVKLKGIAAFATTMGFFAVLGIFIATNYQSWF